MAQHITVVGGGFGGLTAAISAAEAGAAVTLHEAHGTLGGRARTAQAPYRTNEGPHAFYRRGPHWTWLRQRGLVGPLARIPAAEALRMRYHRDGGLHRLPPVGLTRLARRRGAPVGRTFLGWASEVAGERTARAAANFVAVATFHHDPGLLSAAFVQERLRRSASLVPEARYPVGGWQSVIDRMAARARELGVRIETGARVDDLPVGGGPVIVATALDSARRLLGDDGLVWHSGRTLLLDLAVRSRRGGDRSADRPADCGQCRRDLDEHQLVERQATAQEPGAGVDADRDGAVGRVGAGRGGGGAGAGLRAGSGAAWSAVPCRAATSWSGLAWHPPVAPFAKSVVLSRWPVRDPCPYRTHRLLPHRRGSSTFSPGGCGPRGRSV
ncbi:NAD(P)-binding protein [Kitasatospora sp. NPDC001574]